jgi:hypothetical protein
VAAKPAVNASTDFARPNLRASVVRVMLFGLVVTSQSPCVAGSHAPPNYGIHLAADTAKTQLAHSRIVRLPCTTATVVCDGTIVFLPQSAGVNLYRC